MNSVELTRFSLSSALDILDQVCADLTQEQAEWIPPGIANPIGAMWWHALTGADEVVHRWIVGDAPLVEREGWRERALTAVVAEPMGNEGWLEWMRAVRVDLAAVRGYQAAVAADLDLWLESLAEQELDRTVHTPIGEYSVAQVVDLFVIWHINAHCGEISALKGCQGARGYPF